MITSNLKLIQFKSESIFTIFLVISIALIMLVVDNGSTTIKFTNKTIAIIEILLIISCYLICKNKEIKAQRKKHIIILSLFFSWLGFSLISYSYLLFDTEISSQELRSATYRQLFILIHLAFCFFLYRHAYTYPKNYKYALLTIPICCLIMTIGISILLIFGEERSALQWHTDPPFSRHQRGIGLMASLGSVISISFLLSLKKSSLVQAAPLLILIISSLSLLIWSGGRSAIFWSSLIIFSLIISHLIKSQSTYQIKILVISILAAASIGSLISVTESNGLTRTIETINNARINNIKTGNLNNVTTGRLKIWEVSLNEALKTPFLGKGPDAYNRIKGSLYGAEPHNAVIQFFLDWGIIGTTPIVIIISILFWKCFVSLFRKNQTVETKASAATILILILSSIFSGTFYHSQMIFLFALALAIFASQKAFIQNQPK